MTTFEVEFEFREKEEVTRTQIRRLWGLWNHWNNLFGQKYVHGDGIVTGSVVVMQYPSVTMIPISDLFKDLIIVKECRNRPGAAQRVPGGLSSQIS